ncbi:MAG: hypothetical protein ABIY56_00375, partial [Dokdonella sp.]
MATALGHGRSGDLALQSLTDPCHANGSQNCLGSDLAGSLRIDTTTHLPSPTKRAAVAVADAASA